MRKLAMLVGVVALMTMLFASAAFGFAHRCAGSPCTGTNSANMLDERYGNGVPDTISGRGGRDVLRADFYTRDTDLLYGGSANDRLNVNDGDTRDSVSGGGGFDICIVDSRGELSGGCQDVQVHPG